MRILILIGTLSAALLMAGCASNGTQTGAPKTTVAVKGQQLLINGRPETLFGFRVGSAPLREDWTRELIEQLPLWRQYGINSFTLWLQGTSGAHHRLFTDDGKIDPAPGDVISRAGYGLVESAAVVSRESGEAIIARTRRIVEAADRHGMVVVIGIGYRSSWKKTDTVEMAATAMFSAAAPFRDDPNVILNVWNETNTGNALETPQAVARYVAAIRKAAPQRLVCAGSLQSKMNIELAKAVEVDLYCQDAGRNLKDTLTAFEDLRSFGKPIINVESYGGFGGGYIDDINRKLTAPPGYTVEFSTKDGWRRIYGVWEEKDYRDATNRPLMGKHSYRELIRYVGRDSTRQTHLFVHVAGWFQGASRVETAAQIGPRTSPGRWDNTFIAGHGAANGSTAEPGIRWLLEEMRDARR
ncbi:MAG: glycoside hydrolase family 5 protein [Burkholderiales bacterium]|nr:glycoside hydrolase family 5 protein [Burkholderiales bacterium]